MKQTQEILDKDLPESWKLLITSKVSNNLFAKVVNELTRFASHLFYVYGHFEPF